MFTFPSVFYNPISLYLHRGEGGGEDDSHGDGKQHVN